MPRAAFSERFQQEAQPSPRETAVLAPMPSASATMAVSVKPGKLTMAVHTMLDNLDAAVDGRPLPHVTFLPIRAEECGEVSELLRMRDAHASSRRTATRLPVDGLLVIGNANDFERLALAMPLRV